MHKQLIIFVYLLFLLFITDKNAKASEDLPNILLLTIDACRPDHFSCYGYKRNTTPNIDKLAKEGLLFTNAFSQSAWTTPGMVSIFTSLYPLTHGIDTKDKIPDENILTLPKILKINGYAVPVFTKFVEINNYWNLGFDAVDKDQYTVEGEDLLKLIDAYKHQRFFIWYHFHGLHLPYNPPNPYDKIFQKDMNDTSTDSEAVLKVRRYSLIKINSIVASETDKKTIVALYDGLLRQLDDHIGRLIEKMKEWNISNNTLIIITADHGEELFEHGFIGHASTSANAKLYDEIIHIPLIIWWQTKLKHNIINELAQQIDIMPTILDLLYLPIPAELQGRSLLPFVSKKQKFILQPVFCETTIGGYQSTKEMEDIKLRCIRTNKWKLIYTKDTNNDIYELYNLKKDSKEEINIVKKYPDVANDLKNKLFHWIKTYTIENNNSIK